MEVKFKFEIGDLLTLKANVALWQTRPNRDGDMLGEAFAMHRRRAIALPMPHDTPVGGSERDRKGRYRLQRDRSYALPGTGETGEGRRAECGLMLLGSGGTLKVTGKPLSRLPFERT